MGQLGAYSLTATGLVPAGDDREILALARQIAHHTLPHEAFYRAPGYPAVLALGLGLWLWLGYGIGSGAGWMQAKLVVVVLLIGYHHACGSLLKKFHRQQNRRSHVWFRWFNEVPVLLLLAGVALVVLKPF